MNPSPLLDMIDTPQDLRRLEKKQLPQVAAELREFLLDSVGKTGGHFASNLGAVELTVALHYVYDTPEDHLVWDVGHQSYPHKILTGRKNQMHTMRQYGGLAGFPKRSESEYDAFGVGHSSTSIGAALGMAVADKQLGNNRRSVAIIGDGAMTAGQAFEALNCAGDMDVDLLVILNDNEMSISPNVGALPKYLASNVVRDMHGLLSTIKAQSSKVLDKLPGAMELAQKVENKIKTLAGEAEHAKQSLSLFENFGFRYTGPVDGHNVENLVDVLKDLRGRKGPQLLHVITKKGNGYKFAENDPVKYHAVAKLPSEVPAPEVKPAASKPTYTQVFGQWLCDQAAADERWLPSRLPCAKAAAWLSLNSNSPTAISMSVSPSNTPLPLPAVWRAKASSLSWRFTPLSCNALTTSWYTTLPCKTCLFCSPSTAQVLSVQTARPMPVCTT